MLLCLLPENPDYSHRSVKEFVAVGFLELCVFKVKLKFKIFSSLVAFEGLNYNETAVMLC